tara:strand:- start:4783 stop:5910 length:1128 start_codon:yes stop_codon:yes gene_type:complete
MKNLILVFLAVILTQGVLIAQKFDTETADLKYTKLPLKPIPSEAVSYNVEFRNAHEAEVLAAEDAYQQDKQDAQDEVDSEHEAVKIINSISGNSTKKRVVEKPYLPVIYTKDNVLQKFTLNDLEMSDNPDITMIINFNGFTYTKTQSTSTSKEIKYYYYTVKAKNEMSVSIVDAQGTPISDFAVPGCEKVMSSYSRKFTSVSALDAYWSRSKSDVLRPLEKKITDKNIKSAQKEIANQHGTSVETKKIKVAVVRDKKLDYSEYEKAYELVFEGAMLYFDDNDDAQVKIKEALELWEGALKESDLKNKKARINEKVTAATRYNCALFYCWVNQHDKAKFHYMKLKMLDVGKYNRQMKDLKRFIDDHKARYDANMES